MILAHLSDLHLGFRGHGRRERGRDARERDVLEALERAVGELVEIRPDVLVVTGDVFDRPDPDPATLLALTRSLETLRAALPGLAVALLAGPRDLPLQEGEPGVLDVLGGMPGIAAATTESRGLHLGEGRLHLALVPHGALVRDPAREAPSQVAPDPDARFNVLAVHGRVLRLGRRGPRREVGLRVDPGAWDYVALGGEHAHRDAAPNARWAGSLERVGWTPWTEALEEKGFLTVDLERGSSLFHPLPVRPVVALAPIRVGRGDTGRLLRRVREVTSEVPGGVDDRIVRLRLQVADPEDLEVLQDGLLADLAARALHLGVGAEDADDAEASSPGVVERLASLLEAEGADPAGAAALLPDRPDVAPEGSTAASRPLRVGRARLRLPPRGLVALVGREPRERAALARGLRAAAVAAPAAPGDAVALLEAAARRLAGPELEAIETALDRVRSGGPAPAGPRRLRPRPSGSAPAEMRALERELAELRADDAELAGDVEQAAMEWTRERQDAETQLQTYRDRARELKARLRDLETAGKGSPCPTCGRPLAEHFADVVATLRDEWEAVVQDGRWWKRRREQLEEKPEKLRELEGRSLRVHAALEECAERLERARARGGEEALSGAGASGPSAGARATSGSRPAGGGGAPGEGGVPGGESAAPASEASPTARALARLRDERLARARRRAALRASRVVEQVTGGRAVFVSVDREGGPVPQGPSGPLDDPAGEESAAVRLALRAVAASVRPADTLVLPEGTLEALAATDALRAVDVLRALLRSVSRVVVVTDGRVVDRRPEAFDHALQLEGEGEAAWVRTLPVGSGALLLPG